MATKKKYDLAVKTGSYEKDGETKNRYKNIGAVMQGDDGFYMFLDASFNPAGIDRREGSESIIVSMFEPRAKDSQVQPAPQTQSAAPDDFNDPIPF